MTTRSQMLDEALNIGRRELGCLAEGDVFEAEKLSRDRERIIDDAIYGLDQKNLELLADKLVAMKILHDNITGEAKKLHARLKQDLLGMKQQNRRITGYSFGAGNLSQKAQSRFISTKS